MKKYRCVSYRGGKKIRKCVLYKIRGGKRICVKKAMLFRIRYCRKWNKKSKCQKYMHVSTDLRCAVRVKIGRKNVCKKYKIQTPRIYCQHYRMIKGKRVCARTGVFYGAKTKKLVCTKRAKLVKVLRAKTMIKGVRVQKKSAKKAVIGKLDSRSCGCMDYKVVKLRFKYGRKL